jgi:hypothetical protein
VSALRSVYIAHPLSAPTREEIERNRVNAAKWVAWLAWQFPIAPVCTWITLTGEWDESPVNRVLGLEIDKALVRLCGEMWHVGGKVTTGMGIEAQEARVVHDLTHLGYLAPEGHSPLVREVVAEIVGLR